MKEEIIESDEEVITNENDPDFNIIEEDIIILDNEESQFSLNDLEISKLKHYNILSGEEEILSDIFVKKVK